MPDLEQQISAWRSQMLAAGIQSPVPLDELEAHLREDIAEQIKSGLPEEKAFRLAVSALGDGKALRSEFSKSRRWFPRNVPAELALVASLFFLTSLNLLSQLVRFFFFLYRSFAFETRHYIVFSCLGAGSLLFLISGCGLLRRRAFSRHCALALLVLGLLSLVYAEYGYMSTLVAPGTYYIFLGRLFPTRIALFQDLLVAALFLWSGYILTKPSIRQLFRRDQKTKTA